MVFSIGTCIVLALRAIAKPGEQLVGFTCIGTPTRALEPREADDAASRLANWAHRA